VAPDDLELAADRAALAAILDARGRKREARQTLRDVISTLESVLGPDHYEVGLALSELGDMHMSAARFGEAYTALARATAILERVLGRSHPATAACRARREQARIRMDHQSG
jgi:tetratricopeptide (TPR) repeat protein